MAGPSFTPPDLEAARVAIRRGAAVGQPIPRCRCFAADRAFLASSPHCKGGVCEEAAEHVAAAIASGRAELIDALRSAIRIAEEARQEWDRAPGPPAVKSGKLLIALAGHIKGYRADIDAIHAAIAKAEGR